MTATKGNLAYDVSRLSLQDRLGLISLIDEGMRLNPDQAPITSDLFNNLWELVSATAKGAKVDRLGPDGEKNIFRVIEINAESGENLGRLNMIYLKKPLPCYYLVYVEVASPYRRRGLGHMILKHFREFLDEKSALGLLDNIIPQEDPTYDIYQKHGWRPVGQYLQNGNHAGYMIYVPDRFSAAPGELKANILKVLHHLARKRAAIEMRDNEMMVRQTIFEFKDLYAALLTYFENEIHENRPSVLLRFMFTRFVTKLVAFRRRITELLGYTGGESLGQIQLDPKIAGLPIQSYAPMELAGTARVDFAAPDIETLLPPALLQDPDQEIERLANYQRPSLTSWLKENECGPEHTLTIGDLMDLGFDPTRLKEIHLGGKDFIFERLQARQLEDVRLRREVLEQAAKKLVGLSARGAKILVNPPVFAIHNRGSVYVLRPKVQGIHWEEAVEQLQGNPALKKVNEATRMDRLIQGTIRKAAENAAGGLDLTPDELKEKTAFFVSWDLKNNQPRVTADFTTTYLEAVWLA